MYEANALKKIKRDRQAHETGEYISIIATKREKVEEMMVVKKEEGRETEDARVASQSLCDLQGFLSAFITTTHRSSSQAQAHRIKSISLCFSLSLNVSIMTTSPPLFVVPPPANLELKPSSPTDPPTPYTPKSVSTSSVHKQIEVDTPPPLPSERTDSEMKTQPGNRESGGQLGLAGLGNEERREQVQEHASEGTTQAEMIITPPNVTLPSPPLTEIEEQEDSEGNHVPVSRDQPPLHHLAEEDITNWRSSVNGSYQEDDLGEETPVDEVGSHLGARMELGGASQDRLSVPTPRPAPAHPLSLNTKSQPPSPPPWEVIDPPETNNSHLTPVNETFPEGISNGSMPKSL